MLRGHRLAALASVGAATVLATVPVTASQATLGTADSALVRLTGRVDVAPTCPVQRPGEDCVDRGVNATVTFTRRGVTRLAPSGASGFAIRLAPGVWRVTADAGMSCEERRVTLVAGVRHKPLVIRCDSGIR